MPDPKKSENCCDSTVSLIDCCSGNTLCIEFCGTITREDHRNTLRKNLEKILETHDHYNLLIHYKTNFIGWAIDAADSSMETIMDFGPKARKLAYVNPPDRKVLKNKIVTPLLGGEIQYFDEENLQDAITWINA